MIVIQVIYRIEYPETMTEAEVARLIKLYEEGENYDPIIYNGHDWKDFDAEAVQL
jgi:hypothetical protein